MSGRLVLAPHPEHDGIFPGFLNEPLVSVIPRHQSQYRKVMFFCTGEGPSAWCNVASDQFVEWDGAIEPPGEKSADSWLWERAHIISSKRGGEAILRRGARRIALYLLQIGQERQ